MLTAGTERRLTPNLGEVGASAVLAIGIAVIILMGPGTNSEIVGLSVAIFLAGISGALLVTRQHGLRESLAQGKLGPWTSIAVGLMFGLASLQWLGTPGGNAAMIAKSSVVQALWAVLACQVLWMLGYRMNGLGFLRGATARAVAIAIPPRDSGRVWGTGGVLVLFAAGLAGQLLRLRVNAFGYLSDASVQVSTSSGFGQLSTILSNMGLFAVVVAAANYWAPKRAGSLGLLVFVASIQACLALLQASKQSVALVVIAVILGYAASRRRLPVAAIVICIVVFTAVVVPFVTAYRTVARAHGHADIATVVRAAPSIATKQGYGLSSANTEILSQRLRLIDSLAIVEQRSPHQVPYLPLGEVFEQPVIGLVPRIFWPGKPTFTSGYDFGQTYYALPSSLISADAVTPQADLYRRGGIVVLLVGMGVFGALYRLLDDTLHPEIDVRHLFVVVVLFPTMVKLENDMASILLSLPVTLIGVAVATRLLRLFGRGNAIERGSESADMTGRDRERSVREHEVR